MVKSEFNRYAPAGTKKKLMDLGLDSEYAHLWAIDLRMDELIQLNLEETMRHLYRLDASFKKLWGLKAPYTPYNFHSFCRGGPATTPYRNRRLLQDKDETFINYISNFIEGVKVRERGVLLSWRSGLMLDGWGQKNPPRLLLNYSYLPFDNKT